MSGSGYDPYKIQWRSELSPQRLSQGAISETNFAHQPAMERLSLSSIGGKDLGTGITHPLPPPFSDGELSFHSPSQVNCCAEGFAVSYVE